MDKDLYQELCSSRAVIKMHCTLLRSLAKAFFISGNEKAHKQIEDAARTIDAEASSMMGLLDIQTRRGVEKDMAEIDKMKKMLEAR